MKNFLFSSIILFLFSSLLGARTTLTPSQPIGNTGDESLVELYFSSQTVEVVGAQFTLQYDPAALEVGEILPGSSVQDHELFDEQDSTAGTISITLLSMTNKKFNDGKLASISFTLKQDLDGSTDAISLVEEDTLLVTVAGESQGYEAMAMINELYLSFSSSEDSNRPSTSRSVSFSAADDGSDATYTWDFGDGTVKEGKSASHTYEQAAQYLVTLTASNLLGSVETSQSINISAPYWDIDSEDLGNGWKSFDWFGRYFEMDGSNWIYHENLGWLYRSGSTTDNTWLWSDIWQWGWVSDSSYPYVTLSVEDWLYYFNGTSNPVRYYDYDLYKWMEANFLEDRSIELSIKEGEGELDGPSSFYPGQELVFVARPAPGYVFAGWQGENETGINPLIITDARDSFSLQAVFVSSQSVRQSGSSVINLDHLEGKDLQVAVSQLDVLGSSTLVTSGDSPGYEFSVSGDTRILNAVQAGILDQSMGIGVFDGNSGEIEHPYLPVMLPKDFEYFVGQSRKVGEISYNGYEEEEGVQCLVMEIFYHADLVELRHLAQDTLGNVWMIASTLNQSSLQDSPTLLLPATASNEWTSWPSGFSIPQDHAIGMDITSRKRVGGLGALSETIRLHLNRANSEGQKEIFAKGLGLVQVSLH